MDKSYILVLFLLIGLLLLLWYIYRHFKFPKLGMFTLITGGIKTGKSSFSLAYAYSKYKKLHNRWRIRVFFQKLLHKELDEEPLFYSNIPVKFDYVLVNNDLILRNVRPRFGSVIWLDEASLIADSQLIKDADINERIMLWVKLIGHELHGNGMLCINSQSTSDMHYQFRRCCDRRFYVSNCFKWLPFFLIFTIREERYSEDGSILNTYNEDLEDSLKRVLVRKKIFKKFNRCAFSYFTDDKPVSEDVIYYDKCEDDYRVKKLVSFRHFKSLDKEVKN